MVDRHGDNLYLTPEEQVKFDLPERVTADQAIITAVTFTEVARSLLSGTIQDIDSPNRTSVQAARLKTQRANDLGRMSNKLFELCPVEHLQYIANKGQSTK